MQAETIERLKKEKADFESACRKDGESAGYEDAADLSYEEIQAVIGGATLTDLLPWLSDVLVQRAADASGAFDEHLFLDGWVAGVKKFWDEVKSEVLI